MAPCSLVQQPHVLFSFFLFWLLLLLHFWFFVSADVLEVMTDEEAPELKCTKGLTNCHVNSVSSFSAVLPEPNDAVDVTHMQLKVMLCCSATQDCQLCLQIIITVKAAEEHHVKEVSEESGDHTEVEEVEEKEEKKEEMEKEEKKEKEEKEEEKEEMEFLSLNQRAEGSGHHVFNEPPALVKVCLSSPGRQEIWKTLQFKLNQPGVIQPSQTPAEKQMQLLLTETVTFDTPVVVHVYAHSKGTHSMKNITTPSLEEVCSMNLEMTVTECDAPRLRAETDSERNVVLLQLEDTDATRDDLLYQMIWNEMPGEVLSWPKGKKEVVISSNLVTPCLCFQVWWKGNEIRRQFCPFTNQQDALERMQHRVSVSVEESQMREGDTGLSWNVTAPCRLEAEVRLCRKDVAGGRCEEVMGSRQRLHNHEHAGWSATRNGHWKTGEFNMSSHPLLCVQLKIHGMESYSEPQCPFTTSRWRWSLPLLVGLLLMCVAILGAYFIQGVLKGYVWRWLKEDDVKGAVGGGHVVLLYSSDDSQDLPGLMCHLGSSLQTLGFSVSLDLWSQAELSVLGPVPWLHSRLDRLKRQGGKVVLVLTQASWRRAEEWGAQSWERSTPRDGNRHREEEETGISKPTSSPCFDAFSASLSCILADYLQGRAGERFMLIQFESLPPEPHRGFRPLPELFRGLHVYSLPSQSLGFLTELAGDRQTTTASARRKRAGGLRVASRTLARGLSGFTAGTTLLRLAAVPQSCVKAEEEALPLQQCLITPPSSPDSSSKANEMEWV